MSKYSVDQRVVITRGENRGRFGTILGIDEYPSSGLIDYQVDVDGSQETYVVPEEDIRLIMEEQQNLPFDITKYISEDQMKEIYERVFTEECKKYIDERYNQWRKYSKPVIDVILEKVCYMYAEKLAPEYESKFLDICKKVIDEDRSMHDDYDDTIAYAMSNALMVVGKEYIKEHEGELQELIKGTVETAAKNLVPDAFTYELSKRINMKSIMKEILQNVIKE